MNGGACDDVENVSLSASAGSAASDAASVATTARGCVALCTDDGCTKGPCMDGIDLQQSWPLCPCGAHGIEPQHCIACSGVVSAPQSSAYAAKATRSATITSNLKTSLTNPTYSPGASQSIPVKS